jgi:hypothetical protein
MLQRFTTPLLSAPVSYVTAFLILHELTALVPLVGFASFFHYSNWLPESILKNEEGVFNAAIEKWSRYFKRKGWLGDDVSDNQGAETAQANGEDGAVGTIRELEARGDGWRWVVEIATAYVLVKILLPPRLVLSVWASPWFARVAVIPITRVFARFGRRS